MDEKLQASGDQFVWKTPEGFWYDGTRLPQKDTNGKHEKPRSPQFLGGGFKYFLFSSLPGGNDENLRSIFFKWVGSTTSAIGLDIYFPHVVSCNYVTLKRHVQLTRILSLQRDWVSISPIESMSCSEIKLVIWWLVAGCLFFFSCLIYPILPWFQCNKCNPELAEAGNPWSWGHVVALRARFSLCFGRQALGVGIFCRSTCDQSNCEIRPSQLDDRLVNKKAITMTMVSR